MATTTDIGGDVFDLRDAIKRFEELEDDDSRDEEDEAEFATLKSLLADLAGYGGDEQWRGDWYPVTLIRDSYFEEYAQELAEELDLIPADAKWPANCIDWEQAARELRVDYSSVRRV